MDLDHGRAIVNARDKVSVEGHVHDVHYSGVIGLEIINLKMTYHSRFKLETDSIIPFLQP